MSLRRVGIGGHFSGTEHLRQASASSEQRFRPSVAKRKAAFFHPETLQFLDFLPQPKSLRPTSGYNTRNSEVRRTRKFQEAVEEIQFTPPHCKSLTAICHSTFMTTLMMRSAISVSLTRTWLQRAPIRLI